MRAVSGSLIAANVALFLLCLAFTPIYSSVGLPSIGYNWHDWHWFVAPHVALSLGLSAWFARAWARGSNVTAIGIGTLLQCLSPFTWNWAMQKWPGGDDGGGFSWFFFVGPLTAAALVVAACGGWVLIRRTLDTGSGIRWRIEASVLVTLVALGFVVQLLYPWLHEGGIR